MVGRALGNDCGGDFLDAETWTSEVKSKFSSGGGVPSGSDLFKGPATKWHAIHWHVCGVSRVAAQGESICTGETGGMRTVHAIGDRIVI